MKYVCIRKRHSSLAFRVLTSRLDTAFPMEVWCHGNGYLRTVSFDEEGGHPILRHPGDGLAWSMLFRGVVAELRVPACSHGGLWLRREYWVPVS